jgi:hypothetical protein
MDPITVDDVANINSLKVFDSVYTTVRDKPFAAGQAPRYSYFLDTQLISCVTAFTNSRRITVRSE